MTAPEPPPPPRTGPLGWLRDESWWRDVASQAVGGLIVLAVGAILAGLAGLIDFSVVIRVVLWIALVIFGPIAIVAPAMKFYPAIHRFRTWGLAGSVGRRFFWNAATLVLSIVWTLLGAAVLIVCFWLLSLPWK